MAKERKDKEATKKAVSVKPAVKDLKLHKEHAHKVKGGAFPGPEL